MEKLNLTQEWDKVFPKSDKVNHRKVTFRNRCGITLAADLFTPKGAEGKLPAIAVSGPFGAVKEQSSGKVWEGPCTAAVDAPLDARPWFRKQN